VESWFSSLKDLIDLKDGAKLTLPAVLCSFLFIVLFWPPRPLDMIPVVLSLKLPIKLPSELPCGPKAKQMCDGAFGEPASRELIPRTFDPICTVDEYNLNPAPGVTGILFGEYNRRTQRRQYALEEQNENLERCIAEEKRLVGSERATSDDYQGYLKVMEESRAKQASAIVDYERVDSPMLGAAMARRFVIEQQITAARSALAATQQEARDREWEIAELTRWKGVVTERLAEPGRLRPELGFDVYLAVLSKHVMAFVVLAVAVGIVLEALWTPGALQAIEELLFGP
jgi:hypothetical protein